MNDLDARYQKTPEQLYNCFINWCSANGIVQKPSRHVFDGELTSILGRAMRIKDVYMRSIKIVDLRSLVRSAINEPTFDFSA